MNMTRNDVFMKKHVMQDWLAEKEWPQCWFARKIFCPITYFNEVYNGYRPVGKKYQDRILNEMKPLGFDDVFELRRYEKM